jgi:hypothetical protein
MQYIVPLDRLVAVNLNEIDLLLETELGYSVSVTLIGQYLEIDGVAVSDETTVRLLIDEYLKEPEPEPEYPTTNVIAEGLDVRSLDKTRDSVTVRSDGSTFTVDGEVALSPLTLAALENVNATIQSNATVDITKVSGNTIDTGIGNSGTGTFRVVIASNNPSLAVGATQSGRWTVNQGAAWSVRANQSGSWSFTNEVASSATNSATIHSTGLAASSVAKSSAGKLIKIFGYNNGPDQFIQVFNASSVPANGASPISVIKAKASDNFEINFGDNGVYLSTGISFSNSTTAATKTTGANDCIFTVVYK